MAYSNRGAKAVIHNMWKPIVGCIDLEAIFDPPAICTQAQLQDCAAIKHNLQASFLLGLDACINIRVRFEVRFEASAATPLLPSYPNVRSTNGAGTAFFDYWQDMLALENFPQFPDIADFPVAATLTGSRRTRQRFDHPEQPIIPPPPMIGPA